MARARNLKPGFFKNEVLAQCCPHARLLFAGLWCVADRDGRIEDRPLRIKTDTLPYDNVDISALLNELAQAGFLIRYVVGETKVIQILNFKKHQSPHKDETCLELPSPESEGAYIIAQKSPETSRNSTLSPSSLTPSSLTPSSLTDTSLEYCSDPSGESEPPTEEPSPVVMTFPTVGQHSKTWQLTQAKLDEYREAYPGVDVESECRKALQWCRDNTQKRKTPTGMPRFLGKWLGKAQDACAALAVRNGHLRSPPGNPQPRTLTLPPSTDEDYPS